MRGKGFFLRHALRGGVYPIVKFVQFVAKVYPLFFRPSANAPTPIPAPSSSPSGNWP